MDAFVITFCAEKSLRSEVVIRFGEVHDEISGIEAQSEFFGLKERVDQNIGIGCCGVANVGRSRELFDDFTNQQVGL